MYDARVREAVALYLTGALSAEEAARRGGVSPSLVRYYARVCGTVFPAPGPTLDDSNSKSA